MSFKMGPFHYSSRHASPDSGNRGPGWSAGRGAKGVSVGTLVSSARLPLRYWLLVIPTAALGALVVGIPTAVIPNPLFTRMTPTRPLDYVFWAISALLLGMIGATYFVRREEPALPNKVAGGGLLSVLAVGCPICNKLVVLALGVTGALTYFAPIQPLIGLASVGVLVYALRLRFQALQGVCPVG